MEGICLKHCTSTSGQPQTCSHLTPYIKRKCISSVNNQENCLNPEQMPFSEDQKQKKQFAQFQLDSRGQQQLKYASQEQSLRKRTKRFANINKLYPKQKIVNSQATKQELKLSENPYSEHISRISRVYGGAKNVLKNKIALYYKSPKKLSIIQEQSEIILFQEELQVSKQNQDLNCFSGILLPRQLNMSRLDCQFRKGKMLGKGRYCHISVCQESQTYTLFTLKQIFKRQTSHHSNQEYITTLLELLIKLQHPYIIKIYCFYQEPSKISILQQYTPITLNEEIQQKRKLSLSLVIDYLKNIIEAVVRIHDMSLVHGSLNTNQIGILFGVAKVRMNLTKQRKQKNHLFLNDIHAIALIGYEMAFGLLKNRQKQITSFYQQEKEQQYTEQDKMYAIKHLNQENSQQNNNLRKFLLQILCLYQNQKLTASLCLKHQLFKKRDD